MPSNPEQSQSLFNKLIEINKASNSSKIAMGEYLLELKESEGYLDIVGSAGSWKEFLGSPEIKIPYSTAQRYITIAKKYIKELGMSYDDLYGMDTWCLARVAPHITPETKDEWLGRIEALSRADIERLVKYGGKDTMTCQHHWNPMPPKWKCDLCGECTTHQPQ